MPEGWDLVPYYLYRQKNMAGNFENVGYAKVDKAGIYNILIMEEKQSIVACRSRCFHKDRTAGSRLDRNRRKKDGHRACGKCEKIFLRIHRSDR